MRIAASTVVDRSAEEVFAFFADGTTEPRYNPDFSRSERLTGAEIGAGTSFRQSGRRSSTGYEITGFDPPRRFEFRTLEVDLPVDVTASESFTPEAGGTRVDREFGMRPRSRPLALLAPLIRPLVQRRVRGHLENARRLLASGG